MSNYPELEAFYVENRQVLIKRLSYRAGSPEGAEDVLHEAFARAMQYWSSFNPRNNTIGAWFNTIMNNALTDYKRIERSGGTFVEVEEEHFEPVEFTGTEEETIRQVVEYIDQQPPEVSAILTLYFLKEYKPRDIQKVLNVSRRTTDYHLGKARHDLSWLLRPEED